VAGATAFRTIERRISVYAHVAAARAAAGEETPRVVRHPVRRALRRLRRSTGSAARDATQVRPRRAQWACRTGEVSTIIYYLGIGILGVGRHDLRRIIVVDAPFDYSVEDESSMD